MKLKGGNCIILSCSYKEPDAITYYTRDNNIHKSLLFDLVGYNTVVCDEIDIFGTSCWVISADYMSVIQESHQRQHNLAGTRILRQLGCVHNRSFGANKWYGNILIFKQNLWLLSKRESKIIVNECMRVTNQPLIHIYESEEEESTIIE
jgi:hypothetical protein